MVKRVIVAILFLITVLSAQVGESSDLSYGMRLYEDKIYDIAISQFKLFLERHPRSLSAPQAMYYMGRSYEVLKDYENARKNYQQLILSYPTSEFTERAIIDVAEIYKSTGEPEKAARYHLQLKSYFPNSSAVPENVYKAIKIFYDLKNYKEAEDNHALLSRSYPKSYFTILAETIIAKIHEDKKEYALAELSYQKALKNADKEARPEARFEYGSYLLRKNSLFRAKEQFSKVFDEKPHDELYWKTFCAYVELLLSDNDLKMAEAVISSRRDNVSDNYKEKVTMLEGDYFYITDKLPQAELKYKEVYKTSPEALFKLAMTYEKSGQVEKAASILENELSNLPENFAKKATITAARQYIEARKVEKGISLYRHYLRNYTADDKFPLIEFLIAKAYFNNEKYYDSYDAFLNFRTKYQDNKFSDDAVYYFAESAYKLKKYADAHRLYKEVVEKYGAGKFAALSKNRLKQIETYNLKADDAISKMADLTSELMLSGKTTDSYFEWGKFYFYSLKDYVKAARFIEKGIQTTGQKDIESIYILALSYKNIPKASTAIKEKALELLTEITNTQNSSYVSKAYLNMLELVDMIYPQGTADQMKQDYILTALNANIDTDAGDILYNYCIMSNKEQDYERVVKYATKFLARYSTSEYSDHVLFMKAEANIKLGKTTEGLADFERLSKSEQPTPYKLNSFEKLEFYAQTPEEKNNILSNIAAIFPYTDLVTELDVKMAENYLAAKNYDKALEIYLVEQEKQDAENLTPRLFSSKVSYNGKIGKTYFEKNDFNKAEYYLAKAITEKNDIDKLEFLNLLSEIYKIKNDTEALRANLEKIASYSKGSNSKEAAVALADIEFTKGNFSKAAKMYSDILNSDISKKDDVELKLIQAYFYANNLQLAEKLAKNFEDKYPETDKRYAQSIILLARSDYYLQKKSWDKALDGYEDIVDDYEDSSVVPDALYGMGFCLYNAGKKDDAFEVWQRLVKNYSEADKAVEANFHLGAMYLNREMLDKTMESLENVVKYPKNHRLKPLAYKQLIDLYEKLGLNDAASRSIREYINLYPDAEDVFYKRIQLGVIYQKNGEYDLALDYFTRLMYEAKGEDEAAVQFYLAETYMGKKDYRRAISEFLKVKYLIPNTTVNDWKITSVYKSAQCYEALNEPEKAIDLYNEILERYDLNTKYGRHAQKQIDRLKNN